MALSTGDRIDMIRECATLMANMEDIDLILSEYGASTSNWYDEITPRDYVAKMLADADSGILSAIYDYVTRRSDTSRPGQSPWKTDQLRLFCSHLAKHRGLIGEVGSSLQRFGIEPFVAHDSIEPSKEWQQVIEAGLREADAMIVFLHDGFIESRWCDQEVGWAMGRRIPILCLNYGQHPYGFLGKYQDEACLHLRPSQVAERVGDWASRIPTLQGRMGTGLARSFEQSRSWDGTRTLVTMLDRIPSLTEDELQMLERGAASNTQVSQVTIPDGKDKWIAGPEWVAAYAKSRRPPVLRHLESDV